MTNFFYFEKDGKTFAKYYSRKIVGVSYLVSPSIQLLRVKFTDQNSFNWQERKGIHIVDVESFEEAYKFIQVHENKIRAIYNYLDGIGEEYYYENID